MSQNEAIQTAETTPAGPTGPRTEAGKAISSQNALKSGLFAKENFVLPDEQAEYSRDYLVLMEELSPEGLLEQVFAEEIFSANWRLRRCRLIEATLATRALEDETFDDDKLDRKQRSIDRARTAAHTILRRSIVELRRLQTERRIRLELNETGPLGLTDIAKVIRTVDLATAGEEDQPESGPTPAPNKRLTLADLENLMALADKKLCADIRNDPSSFCSPNMSASSRPAPTGEPNRQSAPNALRNPRNQAA
ncbi:MAG TPA: hypothetical protein VKB79_06295 [Bryobacteraceae bacterium]|nr:hypothetical protein [Bryobacteraceae bacterium]